MRLRLCIFKPLLAAASLICAAVAGTELALQVLAGDQAAQPGDLIDRGGLSERSRTVHHRLCPLRTVEMTNADTGELIPVSVNSHGLRGAETQVPKPPGVFRILCMGDEAVLGPTLPEPQSLPVRLQQLLQAQTQLRIEVLNAGIPGDCPLLASLRLRHSLLALQPDLVILHFDMSDVADDQRYRRFTKVDAANAPFACCHPSFERFNRPRPWWVDLQMTGLAARWLDRSSRPDPAVAVTADIDDPLAATAWLRDTPPDWSLYVDQSLVPLEDIQRLTGGTSAQLILATCPQPWQVSSDASSGPGTREAAGVPHDALYTSRAPFEALARFAATRGILFCNAAPAFRDDRDPNRLYQRNAPLLSDLGEELYARVLAQFLLTRLPSSATDNGTRSMAAPSNPLGQPPAIDDSPFYQ